MRLGYIIAELTRNAIGLLVTNAVMSVFMITLDAGSVRVIFAASLSVRSWEPPSAFPGAHGLNKQEVMISATHALLDADGKLTDDAAQNFLAAFLTALRAWTYRLRASA